MKSELHNKYLEQQKIQEKAFNERLVHETESNRDKSESFRLNLAERFSNIQLINRNHRTISKSFRRWLQFTHAHLVEKLKCEMESVRNDITTTKVVSSQTVLLSMTKNMCKRYSQLAFYKWRKSAMEVTKTNLNKQLQTFKESNLKMENNTIWNFKKRVLEKKAMLAFRYWKEQTVRALRLRKCLRKILLKSMHKKMVKALFKWCQKASNVSIMATFKTENRKLIQDYETTMNEMRATSQQFARENNDALVRISSEKQEEIEFLIKKHHEERVHSF